MHNEANVQGAQSHRKRAVNLWKESLTKRPIKLLTIIIRRQQCYAGSVAALFSWNHQCGIQGPFSSFTNSGVHVSTYRLEHITLTVTAEGRQLQSAFKSFGKDLEKLGTIKIFDRKHDSLPIVSMCLICLHKHNTSLLHNVTVILPWSLTALWCGRHCHRDKAE